MMVMECDWCGEKITNLSKFLFGTYKVTIEEVDDDGSTHVLDICNNCKRKVIEYNKQKGAELNE